MEGNINWQIPVLGELNERAISVNEISGKAPGLDGFPVECLMKGCMAVWSV